MNKRAKQKYGKQYKEEKLYDLCDYLARDILVNLRAFERFQGSIPGPLCGPDGKRDVGEAGQEWHEILRKMIWSFDQHVRDNPDEPWKKGYALDSEEEKAYKELVKDGYHLFAEYFEYLWL